MTKNEIDDIIAFIESNYQNFQLNNYTSKYWNEQLSKYDFSDIEEKIQQHLKGEYAYTFPKIDWLTRGLMTSAQKLKQGKMFIKCPICKKKYEYPVEFIRWQKCHQRCRMIQNIVIKSLDCNIDIIEIFGDDVANLKLSEIEEHYTEFLYKFYSKNKDKLSNEEKKYLLKIFETDPKNDYQLKLDFENSENKTYLASDKDNFVGTIVANSSALTKFPIILTLETKKNIIITNLFRCEEGNNRKYYVERSKNGKFNFKFKDFPTNLEKDSKE